MNDHGLKHTKDSWQVSLRHSMRSKFLFAFLTVFLTAFLGAGFIAVKGLPFLGFEGWQSNAKKEAIKRLELVADLEKERLYQWFRERIADAQLIAENQTIRMNAPILFSAPGSVVPRATSEEAYGSEITGMQPYNQASAFLLSIQQANKQGRLTIYTAIRIVDVASGRIVVSTRGDETGSIFSLNDRLMNLVVRTRKSYISDVVDDGQTEHPHFDTGYPVFDSQNKIIGVVVMEVEIERALSLYSHNHSAIGETEEALLVDETVRILTPLRQSLSSGEMAEVMKYQISAKPAQLAAMGHEGVIETEDYRGEKVIAAYRHIRISSDWGWGLVVKIDETELFASINTATSYTYWFAAVGLVLIALLSLLMAHRLISPLTRITAVAVNLASGERFQRIQMNRRDEVGVLASAFNKMVEKLESTNRDLSLRSVEVEAINKELEAFSYSIAHDLRAPLRAINGFSEALIEDHSEQLEGEAKTYLRYVCEGSQEMGRLIDDLLRLSRITRGQMTYEDVDLSSMVADITGQLKLGEPHRDVKVDIAPDAVVSGDSRLLHIVMDNLLNNAWKFTNTKDVAHIEFKAERANGKIRCTVRDNGAGFDMAYENKLFMPFQRLHRSEEFEGNGIGLVTAQRVIRRHGGTIQASGTVGKGASFIFELGAGGKSYD